MKITAIKKGRVAARGSRRCLPGAQETGRASSSSQRPGSSSPGRRRRRRARRAEGPRPLGPGTSATPARVFPSMAAPRRRRRAPGSPGRRPGPASRLGALGPGRGGRCGCGWDGAPRTGAEGGRRGGGGPGAGTADRGRQPHAGLAAPPPSEPPSRCSATRGPGRGEASTTSRPAGRLPAGRPGGGRGAGARRGRAARGRCRVSPRTRLPGGGAGGAREAWARPPRPEHRGPRPGWPRAFRPRGRREGGRQAGEEGSGPENLASPESGGPLAPPLAPGFALLRPVRGSRCEWDAGVRRTAFGAAEGTKRREGRAPFARAPRAVLEVRRAHAQLYPSFLPLEVLPPVWVVKEPPDALGPGGSPTPRVVGLRKAPAEPNCRGAGENRARPGPLRESSPLRQWRDVRG